MSTGNLWMLFKSVTEQAGQQIATVIARDGSIYNVLTMDGNSMDVQGLGVYELQSKVFIQNSKITGEAPNLPFTEISV